MTHAFQADRPEDHGPIATEAEQQLLGALLLRNGRIASVETAGGADLFHDQVHATIYTKIRDAERDGWHAGPVTLGPWADASDGMRDLGGRGYLVRLAGSSISGSLSDHYVQMLVEARAKRMLFKAMGDAREALSREDDPASVIATRLELALSAVGTSSEGPRPVTMTAAVTKAVEQAWAAHNGEQGDFVPTGIRALDGLLTGLYPGELILLGGRPSMGKAQPLDAKILTESGWKRMGDIAVGEHLASVDGAASRVAGIYPQGERQVYRVTFSDGRTVRACGEHLWAVESSKFKGRKVWSTDQIREAIGKERYKRRLSVPLFGGEFGGGDLPVDPWLLGALIGNGNLTNDQPRISTGDAGTLWRIQAAIGSDQRLRASGDYDYAISGAGGINALTTSLRSLGLMGRHSYAKFIPADYLAAPRADRLELMRGLMDTDGWVEKFGAVRYSTSSRQLADDVADLARSLGAVCSISSKEPRYTYKGEDLAGRTHFTLSIRHPDPASLFSLKRKSRLAVRSKPVRLTVVSVEPDGVESVQCIAVTHPSRLYVTDGYAMTHNTATALSVALNAARAGHGVAIASLEMNPEAMALRALSEATSRANRALSYQNIRSGEWTDAQTGDLTAAASLVADLPITFLPRTYSEVSALVAGVRQIKRRMGDDLKLLVVDYAQLLRSQGRSRYDQITEVSLALKALAGQLNIPVLALSQLSRQVESRDDKRPMLSDLRESGQLEQDADAVLFCYRDEYYLEREKPEDADFDALSEWQNAMLRAHGKLEIIVAKQRQGPVGTAHVNCAIAYNRIWEYGE